MVATRHAAALAVVLFLPTFAWAHGGSYAPPGPGGRGADSGGQVPPGTADPPTKVLTRWESWWAANKEQYLKLAERMREDPDAGTVTTPGTNDGDSIRTRKAKEKDAREALVPLFIEALGDDYFDVRTAAAIALGKSEDPRGLQPLQIAARRDDHKEVREAATLGLGLLANEGAVPFLDMLMTDPKAESRQRAFAAFSLGLIGGDDGTASLLRFIDPKAGPKFTGGARKHGPLMASVFVSLGLSRHPLATVSLRSELDKKRHDDTTRSFIILSLGRVADRQMLARFTKMVRRDSDSMLRRSCAIALGKIAKATDTDAVDALFETLHADRDPVTRHFAAVALGEMADNEIRARLRKRFPKADLIDRPFTALALGIAKDGAAAPMLRKALDDANDETEASALCIALALMGDRDAVPLLEEKLGRKGRMWLQSYAAIGLGMLRSKGSIPLLRKKLENSNESRIRMNFGISLGLLHDPEAKRYFTDTMKGDGTLYDRSSAAMSLAMLRVTEAVPDMVALYRNPKEKDMVRAFAVVALGVLADPAPVPKLARIAIDHNYSVRVDPLDEVLSIL